MVSRESRGLPVQPDAIEAALDSNYIAAVVLWQPRGFNCVGHAGDLEPWLLP
jgi:hypothetical protein